MMTELKPIYDSAKSFYGKARVDTSGESTHLISYTTRVATIKNNKPIVYGTYSATTLRHIKEFLAQNGFGRLSKSQIVERYCE